jgi:amino acid transporter
MYQWLVFAHILGVFGFLLAHGTAAAVTFALRRQREVERVRVLLDLSRGVTMVANVSLLVLLAAGITAGFMGNWWGQGWIWASLGLFILIGVTMTLLGSRPLNRIRQLVHADNPSRSETISHSSLDTSAEKQLAVLLAATHSWLLTVIGGGGLALILWLMMFKPF